MSSKARRKSRKVSVPDDQRVWNLRTIGALAGILVLVSLIVFVGVRMKQAQADYLPQEFEGRIVDRWAGSNATQLGDNPYYRLLVEIDGQQRTVPVNRQIYEEAQVGMRLRRSSKGLEVIRDIQRR